jgi:adenylate cyclase
LRANGATDYFAFFQSYGHTDKLLWADLPPGLAGVPTAFTTRRAGGFTDMEIEYLKALAVPLALAVKASTTYDLSKVLLNTYLGKYSGGHVLDGLVERGDGRLIDCVLWYCDLRDSTRLADEMLLDDYLATLNDYFDCTAGAVLDHGGEVLKFIGDAVKAIFPVEEGTRPAADMCRAALMTAKDAIARAQRLNGVRAGNGLPDINFGIALHVGQVMYGNVGTERRLDFTVIGPAANEVALLDGLSK